MGVCLWLVGVCVFALDQQLGSKGFVSVGTNLGNSFLKTLSG